MSCFTPGHGTLMISSASACHLRGTKGVLGRSPRNCQYPGTAYSVIPVRPPDLFILTLDHRQSLGFAERGDELGNCTGVLLLHFVYEKGLGAEQEVETLGYCSRT